MIMFIDLILALPIVAIALAIYLLLRKNYRFSYLAILSLCTAIGYPVAYAVYFSSIGYKMAAFRFIFSIGILIVGSSIISGRVAQKQISRSPIPLKGYPLAALGMIIGWIILVIVLGVWFYGFVTLVLPLSSGI